MGSLCSKGVWERWLAITGSASSPRPRTAYPLPSAPGATTINLGGESAVLTRMIPCAHPHVTLAGIEETQIDLSTVPPCYLFHSKQRPRKPMFKGSTRRGERSGSRMGASQRACTLLSMTTSPPAVPTAKPPSPPRRNVAHVAWAASSPVSGFMFRV